MPFAPTVSPRALLPPRVASGVVPPIRIAPSQPSCTPVPRLAKPQSSIQNICHLFDPHDRNQVMGTTGDRQVGLTQGNPAGGPTGFECIGFDAAQTGRRRNRSAELALNLKRAAERN